ncbi:MAG TPA: L-threonylcarbamoyladenylate synthase [Ideonella sp.]|uniref:L-threonylcarbamoyladenylate synthase n=1 Tax=Ideonella sp. TaxID=1929293 RepID=UPI002C196201|nr:L-threonylcarbamoyladenylate synthase [Ideonella sp.]HSI50102.1 L-threonylcarbamoyladenylate synthase [Ideonella sp.]
MSILQGGDPAAITLAAQRLAAGELVALPTETVYGLGARADKPAAVARIFAAKGRPSDHPLIVHVPDVAAAQVFAAGWPASAQRLASAFWPGPVTVIVPRRAGLAEAAAGGQDSIGLRCPAHPVALAVLKAAATLGVPGVAAPSANGFGRVSPTSAAHVAGEFGEDLLVLDGGDCEVGIESTIVDCSRSRPVLLRPGRLTRAELEAVLGEPLQDRDAAAPRAPGTLEAHYAPRAKVRLMDAAQLQAALQVLGDGEPGAKPLAAVYSRTVRPASRRMPYRAMPQDAAAAAHELFAALRALDALGVPLIWIETPPADAAWEGVRDRLQRAAAA